MFSSHHIREAASNKAKYFIVMPNKPMRTLIYCQLVGELVGVLHVYIQNLLFFFLSLRLVFGSNSE